MPWGFGLGGGLVDEGGAAAMDAAPAGITDRVASAPPPLLDFDGDVERPYTCGVDRSLARVNHLNRRVRATFRKRAGEGSVVRNSWSAPSASRSTAPGERALTRARSSVDETAILNCVQYHGWVSMPSPRSRYASSEGPLRFHDCPQWPGRDFNLT